MIAQATWSPHRLDQASLAQLPHLEGIMAKINQGRGKKGAIRNVRSLLVLGDTERKALLQPLLTEAQYDELMEAARQIPILQHHRLAVTRMLLICFLVTFSQHL